MANVLCFHGYIVYGTWQSSNFVSCWLHVLRRLGNVERRGHRRSDSLSFRNVLVACCNTRRLASHRREHNPPISREDSLQSLSPRAPLTRHLLLSAVFRLLLRHENKTTFYDPHHPVLASSL